MLGVQWGGAMNATPPPWGSGDQVGILGVHGSEDAIPVADGSGHALHHDADDGAEPIPLRRLHRPTEARRVEQVEEGDPVLGGEGHGHDGEGVAPHRLAHAGTGVGADGGVQAIPFGLPLGRVGASVPQGGGEGVEGECVEGQVH